MQSKFFFVFAIFVVLGLIIAYALGVESGKRATVYRLPDKPVAKIPEDIVVFKGKDNQPLEQKRVDQKAVNADIKAKKAKIKENLPFTVQIVAYKKLDSAEKKADSLMKSGKKVFIIPNKNKTWYQVCIGAFKNREQAKVLEAEVEKKYKGCFVREK